MDGFEKLPDLPEAEPITLEALNACFARMEAGTDPEPMVFPASWKDGMAKTGFLSEQDGKYFWAGVWAVFTESP